MKKSILFVVALAAAAAFSSCKKDRVCTCTVETTGTFNFSATVDTTFVDMSKSDAEAKCTAENSSFSAGGETATTTCELQ